MAGWQSLRAGIIATTILLVLLPPTPTAEAMGTSCTVESGVNDSCVFLCTTGSTLWVGASQSTSTYLKISAWCGVERPLNAASDVEIPGVSVMCGGIAITSCTDETFPVVATSTTKLLYGYCYFDWFAAGATGTCGVA